MPTASSSGRRPGPPSSQLGGTTRDLEMKSILHRPISRRARAASRASRLPAARLKGDAGCPGAVPTLGPWGTRARGGVGHALPGKAQRGIVAQHAALDGQDDAVQLGGHPVGLLAEGWLQDGGSVEPGETRIVLDDLPDPGAWRETVGTSHLQAGLVRRRSGRIASGRPRSAPDNASAGGTTQQGPWCHAHRVVSLNRPASNGNITPM